MKKFSEFRTTSTVLHENLTVGRDLNFVELASLAYEEETEKAETVPDFMVDEEEVTEDAPANNAGGGAVAGLGAGPNGEPGVPLKKKQALVVGPTPTDPRVFTNKIFNRTPPV